MIFTASLTLNIKIPFVLSISTFFGGHEPQYATPKNQHTWFKDFALSC
jgi:hypothetical protein